MLGKVVIFLLSWTSWGSCLHWHRNLQHSSVFVQPEQIHLSLDGRTNAMVVTWSTMNSTFGPGMGNGSFVMYGKEAFNMDRTAAATETLFVDGGELKHKQYIQRARMVDLEPNATYAYIVGCNVTLSNIFFFRTFPSADDTNWKPRIALYGDMGNYNAQSLPRLQRETMKGELDAIVHVGDFAYDFHDDNGYVGDEFMRQIESIAAYVPYMTCPGNHEAQYNFSHYKSRFTMPEARPGDMFYSFDLGPVHFVSISTEYYFNLNSYDPKRAIRQRDWLIKDLKTANTRSDREARPWIIIFGHRPMYCDTDDDMCDDNTNALRTGVPTFKLPGFEDLLYNYGVDVAIWAHEHNYERLWPVYNLKVMNGSWSQPYVNPKATVHIVTGSAGSDENIDPFIGKKPYTAFMSEDFGFTKLRIHNRTHLEFSQISDDKNGEVVDHFWIVKNIPGSFRHPIPSVNIV